MNPAFSDTGIGSPDVLIIISYLVCMRIGNPVGTEQTVTVEIEIRGIIFIIISSVGKDIPPSGLRR
jgi:hypothetical protein